jgi:hypothetical protein
MRCDAFRVAVEARDLDATIASLSPTVVLRSPVRDEPLRGRQAVRAPPLPCGWRGRLGIGQVLVVESRHAGQFPSALR